MSPSLKRVRLAQYQPRNPIVFLNALLASLNARKSLREELSDADAVTLPWPSSDSGSGGLGRQATNNSTMVSAPYYLTCDGNVRTH